MAQKTVTRQGDAQIDTAQSKFGGASGLFDGTGDYLTIPDDADWDIIGADFSIDFQMRLATRNNGEGGWFGGQLDSGGSSWGIRYGYTSAGDMDNLEIFNYDIGLGDYTILWGINLATKFAINTWYHIAFAKTGATIKMFIDGVSQTLYSSVDGTPTSCNGVFALGMRNDGYRPFNGWIDEYRISKGTNLIGTANFTPPTSAYGYAASNVLLLHMDGTDASPTFTDDSATQDATAANHWLLMGV